MQLASLSHSDFVFCAGLLALTVPTVAHAQVEVLPIVMANTGACGLQPCGGTFPNELAKVTIGGPKLSTEKLEGAREHA